MAFSICYKRIIPNGKRSYPGSKKAPWRMTRFWSFCMTPTYNTSCWILSAMSSEIQEWSHKSRSRINNLYLLTRRIARRLNAIMSRTLTFSFSSSSREELRVCSAELLRHCTARDVSLARHHVHDVHMAADMAPPE